MGFLKKVLITLFVGLSVGFFFYVFYTQVYSPLKQSPKDTPENVDIPALVQGYFKTIFK